MYCERNILHDHMYKQERQIMHLEQIMCSRSKRKKKKHIPINKNYHTSISIKININKNYRIEMKIVRIIMEYYLRQFDAFKFFLGVHLHGRISI